MISAKDIISQILREAEDRSLSIGKTQLIKLLYLTEVEYFRLTKKRLTNLDWIFYLYGPYAYEIESILDEKEFQHDSWKTQKEQDFIHYKISESKSYYRTFVDAKISLIVKKIVGVWGGKSLPELLNFVYFETEPMQAVKDRGNSLDFETIKQEATEPIYQIIATRETRKKVEELRDRLKPEFRKLGELRAIYSHRDKDELEALEEWDKTSEEVQIPEIIVRFSSR